MGPKRKRPGGSPAQSVARKIKARYSRHSPGKLDRVRRALLDVQRNEEIMATSDSSMGTLSEDVFDYKCTALCWSKKLVKEADRACPDCKKYFCTSCLDVHNNMHYDHNTVEPSALFSSQPTKLSLEQCMKHVGKTIDVWCVQHDVVCCVTCAFFEHRSCEGVKDIQTDIKEIFKQEDFDLTKALLNSKLEYLKDRQRFLNEEKEKLLVEKNKQLTNIEEFSRKLISMIEESKDEILSKFKEIEDEMQKVADDCKHYEEKIRQCITQYESGTGNEPQKFITMKNAQQTIDLADKKCLDPVIGDCTVVFKKDCNNEQYLSGIHSLGSSSKLLRRYVLKNKQEINVKMSDDSEYCKIEGSCLLPDGSVVVTDTVNKKLKNVDISSSSVIDSCTVPDEPYGVCCVGQHELAVALCDQKIQLVTLGRRMALSRTIDVDHVCCGIAYHNGELFVSDNDETIFVYNLQGSLLRKLTNITSVRCKYMAVSRDGRKVFTACSAGGLVCTDRLGSPLYTYTEEKISYCHGVCLDNRSSMFVCGYCSDNVVQMSESGEEVGEIINNSDGVYSPKALCFDPSRQRLVVTQETEKVLVFELELTH